MSYLKDYVYYSSGHEVPEEYVWWGGLSILGHILGHKVYVELGDYFRFYPNLYVCLVGEPGSGKNTAIGVNLDIMIRYFPHLIVSASIQSREDIAFLMSQPEAVVTWKDEKGELHEYRPFYALNNELASFLSVERVKMVEFLVEIYDGKRFGTGFKSMRKDNPGVRQWFDNPHFSLLAGAVPAYFMGELKDDLFSGGLGRRLIIVHSRREKVVPIPRKPSGADEALARAVEHLKLAEQFYGRLKLSNVALTWWNEWYPAHRQKRVDDPILAQFYSTKHMQLLKVAMCLLLSEQPLRQTVEDYHLQAALELLEGLEPAIIRLTSGIGRNELAGIGAQMIDFIERCGGMAPELIVKRVFSRHLRDLEFKEQVQQLIETERLVVADATINGVRKRYYFLPERFEALQKEAGRERGSGPLPEAGQGGSGAIPPASTGQVSARPSGS